jgi:hypothetical protein
MFERPHHQRIAHVLAALDGASLQQRSCLFGGGTCIALRFGEYRESVDIDFLVSDANGYREQPLVMLREVRADQYGIRTQVQMDAMAIKLEIVREGRISLDAPSEADQICGISTLTPLDMAASKLLANSDRYVDDGAFSRDLIDLAMMSLPLPALRKAMAKAELPYGQAVSHDLGKAIDRMQSRVGWLERCMQVMAIDQPKAVLWQKIRALRRVLPPGT